MFKGGEKERATGFEPATPSLGSSYSTTELCPLFLLRLIAGDKNLIVPCRFVNTIPSEMEQEPAKKRRLTP